MEDEKAEGKKVKSLKKKERKENMTKKIAYFGVLLSLSLILSYVESLFPFGFGIPGVKLGLANLVTMIALFCLGMGQAILISVLRIILSGILFGNMFSIVYSLSGAALSLLIMILLKRTGLFSVLGISIAGGVAHNIGQIVLATFLMENKAFFYYIPVLLVVGSITGMLIGIGSNEVMKRLPKFQI